VAAGKRFVLCHSRLLLLRFFFLFFVLLLGGVEHDSS
jgi:hypothetical protein